LCTYAVYVRDSGVAPASFGPASGEHVHVRGALGTLRERHLVASRAPGWMVKLLAFLVIMGSGIVVMIGDNDAGGVTTYVQAGQAFGYSLLWVFPLLLVVLYIAQEMVGRLGAVTGVGHGKLLRSRFGRAWAAFSVFDLFLLNFLTLLTEFIGADLGLRYFGVPAQISVPLMALALVAIVLGRQFYRLAQFVAPALGTVFAIVLVNAAMIGAATVTLSTSYAIGDFFGVDSSLNARLRDAKGFYASYVLSVAAAGAIVLVPHLPLGVVNLGVQVLSGILLPSALGFLLLLCNDKELLGPWVNSPWLNVVATLVVALLLELSLVLTIGTVWPSVNLTLVTGALGALVLLATAGVAVVQRHKAGRWRAEPAELALALARRADWVTPPHVLARPLPKSKGRNLVLGTMRVYLVVAMVLMAVSLTRLVR
jgi:Mn2+/Fe2+ NRAMP family transporter